MASTRTSNEAGAAVDLRALDLAPDDARRLEQLIDRRLQAQERELDNAVQQALQIVPRLLRAPLRRILGL